MSIYFQCKWPVVDLAAVAAVQNIAANGSAILDGTFANPYIANQISFIAHGFSRVVSITSANNLSARTFTVRGLQNGASVSENITGPNNTTVYGLLSFDVITSVTTNGTSNGVSIGTGDAGYLPIIQVNNIVRAFPNWTIGAFLPLNPASGLSYQIYQTIDPIANNSLSFDSMGAAGSGLLYSTLFTGAQTTSKQFTSTGPTANYLLVNIAASTHPTTDTLILSFYQN